MKSKISAINQIVVPYITGDGIGIDITPVALKVIDAAVSKAYNNKRRIIWKEIAAGKKAYSELGEYLPKSTIDAIKKYKIALKGPLETPVGKGVRSLNVELRQKLDLYVNMRPVRYFNGMPSPMKHPEKVDMVIFRENTEDVYSGIEFRESSSQAKQLINFIKTKFNLDIRKDSGIGIKPISSYASKRLIKAAIQYAIKNKRRSITLMHKGNIMKFTEGAFMQYGYEVAKKEFSRFTMAESELNDKNKNKSKNRIIIKDRIADSMFQQVLLRPDEYEIIATTNLNGDYISDALAAQVGGIGVAPGANINFDNNAAVFEPVHGTVPKYAGHDKVNPSSMILAGAMLLEFINWNKAAESILSALNKTIKNKTVTYDLARQINGAKCLKCSEFGGEIIKNM